MNGGNGIASADDRSGAGTCSGGDGSGDFERAIGEGGHFENAHGAVPNDSLGLGNFRCKRGDRFGTDVEAHLVSGRIADVDRGCRGSRLEFRGDDVVDREQELEVFLLRVSENFTGKVEFVILDERFADGQALGFEKGVGHTAADEHGVGDFHEVFDDFDFVADFCSSENRDERARGIGESLAEVVELFFHQQAGCGMLDEVGDADDGSVGAMGGAESVADEDAVAKRGKLLREGFVVLFLFGMEADVFEKKDIAVGERLALRFWDGADAIRGETNGLADQSFELLGGRKKRILGIRTAFGPPQMRSEDQACAFLNGQAQGGDSFTNAGIVGDHAVLERDVEVHANEYALAAEFEIVDGEFVHRFLTRDSLLEIRTSFFVKGTGGMSPPLHAHSG